MALASNLWWTWHPEVINLFRDLDPIRWRQLDHNPIALLREFTPDRLEVRATEMVLYSRINHAYRQLKEYMSNVAEHLGGNERGRAWVPSRWRTFRPNSAFTNRFRSIRAAWASCRAITLRVRAGWAFLWSRWACFTIQGYFKQRLDEKGYQLEEYLDTKVENLPLEPAVDHAGEPITIKIETRTGPVACSRLANACGSRSALSAGLRRRREQPGGSVADEPTCMVATSEREFARSWSWASVAYGPCTALGITPGVYHLNEGHSAFAPLEAIRERMHEDGIGFDDALRDVAQHTVFTTHTPVPAGHDRFSRRG